MRNLNKVATVVKESTEYTDMGNIVTIWNSEDREQNHFISRGVNKKHLNYLSEHTSRDSSNSVDRSRPMVVTIFLALSIIAFFIALQKNNFTFHGFTILSIPIVASIAFLAMTILKRHMRKREDEAEQKRQSDIRSAVDSGLLLRVKQEHSLSIMRDFIRVRDRLVEHIKVLGDTKDLGLLQKAIRAVLELDSTPHVKPIPNNIDPDSPSNSMTVREFVAAHKKASKDYDNKLEECNRILKEYQELETQIYAMVELMALKKSAVEVA